jgi:hypothetical protein
MINLQFVPKTMKLSSIFMATKAGTEGAGGESAKYYSPLQPPSLQRIIFFRNVFKH